MYLFIIINLTLPFLHIKAELAKISHPFFFENTWSYIKANLEYIAIISILVIIVYIIECIRYKYKIRKYVNNDTVNLGQIKIGGGLEKILNNEQIALVIRSEFSAIDQCLKNMAREQLYSSPAQASSEDYYYFFSGTKDDNAIVRQLTSIPIIHGLKKLPVIQDNIILGIGSFKIPVSDIIRSIISFITFLPIKPRNIYKRSLIHISLISHENNAKVVVHTAGENDKGGSHVSSVTSLSSFESIDELNSLLRDMAFMVLELHNAFGDCHWKSMRHLLDGFREFSRFRNSGLLNDRNEAKKSFYKAIAIDPENNLEALYYSAVMSMVERTTDAIEKSINYFTSALRTKDKKLTALINLGLAFCYAQSYHRLGKTNVKMIDNANKAIQEVKKYWNSRQKPVDHMNTTTNPDYFELPLIPYIRAMIELAVCYTQRYIRLEKKNDKMILKANKKILKANDEIKKLKKYWESRKKLLDQMNTTTNTDYFELPLIPYTEAMIKLVEAVSKENCKEKEKSINDALTLAYSAHDLDPQNSMFTNIIGWALMRLALSCSEELLNKKLVKDIPYDEYKESFSALLSQKYLQDALILNPNNKLTHANLCLLYSTPFFKKRNKKDKYGLIYLASRFHGKKAISIDKDYINGYRDLCFAYIRYGKVEEAEKCFHKALELAENPCKDAEIFRDIINEAGRYKIPKRVLKKWAIPQPMFFEPHK